MTSVGLSAPRERRAIDPVFLGQLALPLALVGIWQIVGMLAGDFYVATPVQAFDAVAGSDWFWGSLWATLSATLVGFAIAAVFGLWIGVTLVSSASGARSSSP